MDVRSLPVGQGLAWFRQAIDLGGRNPRAVFGAALLLIAALYASMLLMVLLVRGMLGVGTRVAPDGAPDLGLMAGVVLPLTVLLMLLVPVLLGGLMHVIREVEAGRAVRAFDVFAPLRNASGRRLALLGLVQVGLALAGGVAMVGIAGGDYWRDYLAAMQAATQGSVPVAPQPHNAGLLFLVQLAYNYFSYALMLFSIPLMLFSGSALGAALRDSLRASVRNVGANLLAGGLFVGALLAAAIAMALLVALATLLGSLVHPALGVALGFLLMIGFAAVALVLVVGAAYLAWRDTFGDAMPPPADAAHAIEV